MSKEIESEHEQKTPAKITAEKTVTPHNETSKEHAAELGRLMVMSRDTLFSDFHDGFTEQQAIYDDAAKSNKIATQKVWMTARAVLSDRQFIKYKPLNDFLNKPPEGEDYDPASPPK